MIIINKFSFSYKNYLLLLSPRYQINIVILFIAFIIIFISLFYFKAYDIYNFKGYYTCDDKCSIKITSDILKINKLSDIDYLKVNNKKIDFNNVSIGDIEIDENNKSNYQIVSYEVNQLDNEKINTFQDVKIYSNYEDIFTKIKKIIF